AMISSAERGWSAHAGLAIRTSAASAHNERMRMARSIHEPLAAAGGQITLRLDDAHLVRNPGYAGAKRPRPRRSRGLACAKKIKEFRKVRRIVVAGGAASWWCSSVSRAS